MKERTRIILESIGGTLFILFVAYILWLGADAFLESLGK